MLCLFRYLRASHLLDQPDDCARAEAVGAEVEVGLRILEGAYAAGGLDLHALRMAHKQLDVMHGRAVL